MKKLLALILIATIALSGCAFVRGGLQFVDEKVCPTIEMAKEAVVAAGFLRAYPQFAAAFAVFSFLSTGGCATAKQIRQALEDYDQVKVPLRGVGQVKPELKALRAAVRN